MQPRNLRQIIDFSLDRLCLTARERIPGPRFTPGTRAWQRLINADHASMLRNFDAQRQPGLRRVTRESS